MKISAQIFNIPTEYPNRYRQRNLLWYGLAQFTLIFIFLYLFMPFGVNNAELKFSYPIICALHALVPASIFYLYFSLLNYFRDRLAKPSWTLKKEFLHLAVLFLLIGIAGFLLRSLIYNNPNNLSFYYLGMEIRNVFLVGGLIYTYLIFARFYFKPVSPIEILFTPAATQSPDVVSTSIFIKAHVKIDDFYFNPNDLLFAKAEGNYVTLNILKDGHLKTELKRISLKQFEQQLTEFPNLIRCHRAYLINLQQVIKFSGNSQGYLTYFNGTADKIPVSRAYLDVFDQTYKQLSLA